MNVLVANKAMQNIFVQPSFGAEGKRLGVKCYTNAYNPRTRQIEFLIICQWPVGTCFRSGDVYIVSLTRLSVQNELKMYVSQLEKIHFDTNHALLLVSYCNWTLSISSNFSIGWVYSPDGSFWRGLSKCGEKTPPCRGHCQLY